MASNLGYALDKYKWFLGQIPPGWNEHVKNAKWSDSHGDRVKVRIPGYHPMSDPSDATVLKDSDLPWAIVARPTTHGNMNNVSTGLWGGEWVIGFFMDENCQLPIITQVLGNNLTQYSINESQNGTTNGKRVNRFNSGLVAGPHHLRGFASAKEKFEETDKSFFDNAKTK